MTRLPESWFKTRPLILGHRGASKHAPENTLAAFEAALAAGADGVELDVHLTADGVPVVIHNARVDATTDGQGRVADLTLAEIQELDAGSHLGSAFRGERIPTLEEVLTAVGDRLLVNIELKPQPRHVIGLEATVASLVRRLQLADRVWVSSFKPYALFRMRQEAPEIPCGLLFSPLTPGVGCLAPVTPFEALHPHASLIRRWNVRVAHRLGLPVMAWTVDDPEEARMLASWGVDGIISNDPGAIRRAVGSESADEAPQGPAVVISR